MTVYEMIQELSQYEADQEVGINIVADEFPATVVAREDTQEGEEINTEVDFDEDVTEFYINDYKMYNGQRIVRINVCLE